MSKTAEFVLNEVVGDFLKAGIRAESLTNVPIDLPVNEETDTEKRKRPCVVVSSTEGDVLHPRLVSRELNVEVLYQRDDTEAAVVSGWLAEIRKYLAGGMMEVCELLHAQGWLVRTWVQVGDVSDEDEKRGWREGVSYKVVLMRE